MAEFDGRVAIVTGGANGIGRATSLMLGARGARVVVADIDLDAAKIVAGEIYSKDGTALAVRHDVRNLESSQQLVEQTIDEFASIDILVNNAGTGPHPTSIVDLTEEEYDRVMDVNAKGMVLTTKAVVGTMIEKKYGRIINLSSVVGKKAPPYIVPYAMSKWAAIGFTQCVAGELATQGITVNAVCPGAIKTPLHAVVVGDLMGMRNQTEEEVWDWYRSMIPQGTLQESDDMAEMIVFLASDRAKTITGSSFNVNGGWEYN